MIVAEDDFGSGVHSNFRYISTYINNVQTDNSYFHFDFGTTGYSTDSKKDYYFFIGDF